MKKKPRGKSFIKGDDSRRFGKGSKHSADVRKQMSSVRRGVKLNVEHKTTENQRIRESTEYKLWRKAVLERDKFTCIWCGLKFIKGVTGDIRLQADHIKPFAHYPELRFAIDNGRTLCVKCHRTTDTYGLRSVKR